MFSSVGWGEIAVLILAALFIFGPDRLPGAAKQAGSVLKSLRKQLTGARKQIKDEFGDVVPNFDPALLNPREFIRRNLLEDLDDDESDQEATNVMQTATPATARTPDAGRPPAALSNQPVLYDEETT